MGFFEKEPTHNLYNRERVRVVSNDKLIMAKKYRELEKENFRKKLSKGLAEENYRPDKAWRPGGSALFSSKGARKTDFLIQVQLKDSK